MERKCHVVWLLFAVEGFLLLSIASAYTPCFSKKTPDIPSDHFFNTKKKPLVIGHRGQPRVYQENSLEGVNSLVGLGADGFAVDVYLTNSGQLVCFKDDNAMQLTGVNKNIWDMTPAEISNLTYKQNLTYGTLNYNFPKRLKVALLEDILNATKNTNLLMYLEMKPTEIVPGLKATNTGKAVAKMITRLGLEKRAFIASFNPFKVHAAKQENPDLTIGSFYKERYWLLNTYEFQAVAAALKTLPGMSTCLSQLPFDRKFTDFLVEKGSIFKSINASFIDLPYTIYNNPAYSMNTVDTLKSNYNPKISYGAFAVYSMQLNATELKADEQKVESLIKGGAERLITDDIPKAKDKRQKLLWGSNAITIKGAAYLQLACFLCIFCFRFLNI